MAILEGVKCLTIVRAHGRSYCRKVIRELETEMCNTTLPFTPERKAFEDKQFCLAGYMGLFSNLPEEPDALVYIKTFENHLKIARYSMKMFYGESAEIYAYSRMGIALKKMHQKYQQCVFH